MLGDYKLKIMDKIIVFKNRIEVKILAIVYVILFIPTSVLLIIYVINTHDYHMLILFVFIFVFLFILYIINRFSIIFDYQKEEIRFTNYFSKIKVFNFKEIKVYYEKSKNTLPNCFDYIFYHNDIKIFKIDSINFEAQTKESCEYLNKLFSGVQKYIYELNKLSIKDGYIGFYTYNLSERIAAVYLSNDYTIKIGYDNECSCFKIIACKDIDEAIDENNIKDITFLFVAIQSLINKYQWLRDMFWHRFVFQNIVEVISSLVLQNISKR